MEFSFLKLSFLVGHFVINILQLSLPDSIAVCVLILVLRVQRLHPTDEKQPQSFGVSEPGKLRGKKTKTIVKL